MKEKKRNVYVWSEEKRRYILETPKVEKKPTPKKKKPAKKAAK